MSELMNDIFIHNGLQNCSNSETTVLYICVLDQKPFFRLKTRKNRLIDPFNQNLKMQRFKWVSKKSFS